MVIRGRVQEIPPSEPPRVSQEAFSCERRRAQKGGCPVQCLSPDSPD